MIMWIILGSLIGIVIIFIVVTSMLDHKKRKKNKIKIELANKESMESIKKVAILITVILELNDKRLKQFVPSTGNLKMSDINNIAKKQINDLENSKLYKMILKDDSMFVQIQNLITLFKKTKSNMWRKKINQDISIVEKISKNSTKEFKDFKKSETERLKKYKIYDISK